MSKRLTTEIFIERAKQFHGDKYDYSKVKYTSDRGKVVIICPKHGEFEQMAGNHINPRIKAGCPYCAHKKVFKGETDFLSQYPDLAKDWDYELNDVSPDEVFYGTGKKYWFTCERGHHYQQSLNNKTNHNYGCPICSGQMLLQGYNDLKTVYPDVAKLWSDRNSKLPSDYSYGSGHRAWWKCEECGHEYQREINLQIRGHGCPKCKRSFLEKEVEQFLIQNGIKFEMHKSFDWLGRKHLDFYIPSGKLAIECQGRQHFSPIDWFGGIESTEQVIEWDKSKMQLCKNHNIDIVYYANKDYAPDDWFYKIETDKNSVLNCIKERLNYA